jgi:branched-chain amino acid transport system permease protein
MKRKLPWVVGAGLVALPFVYHAPYPLHILVIVLIWSSMYTSWSVMGRFGLVSLGHGGFMGIGAYVTALLWNHFHLILLHGSASRWRCSSSAPSRC